MLRVEKPKLRLAVVPNHRDTWNGPLVVDIKNAVDEKMKEFAELFDFEIVTADGIDFPQKVFHYGKRTFTFDKDIMMSDYGDAVLVAEYLKTQNIDTLILGCTHYPLLRSLLGKCMGSSVQLVNPAYETAVSLRELLKEKDLLAEELPEGRMPAHRFFVSDGAEKFEVFANSILPYELRKTQVVDIEGY